MKKNQLSVRLNNNPIGILSQTSAGKMTFQYDSSASQMISLGLPIREEPYDEIQTEAYFAGLLPESETVKKLLAKKYSISAQNNFALLKAIGHDCAGAISCHEEDKPINPKSAYTPTGRILSDAELYKHIIELPQKPFFMDENNLLRLSLAGVQDKAAILLLENKIALPVDDCPSTHILKPSQKHFEDMATNEYFCLRIAKQLGLPIPDIQLRTVEDATFLLIERYDRRINKDYIERIHQEDFCQALSVPSLKKYQNEGGPGFKECFDLLKNISQPAKDRNLLALAMVFNFLIGNMDAHAKNFSLVHHSPSNIRLAPFYDLVCTRVYQKLTSKMAMKIGNKYEADDLFPRHWEQLCESINYRFISMKKLIKNTSELILKIAHEEHEILRSAGKSKPIVEKIIRVIEANVQEVNERFF